MAVTIKEISKRTGLSIPTVGNVLGRSAARYSAETQKKVLEAARDMGYKPNASARAIRRGKFGCASLVLSRSKQLILSHIPHGLMDGLDEALAERDMHLTVARLTDEELVSADFLPKVMRESMADGMIVNYTHNIPERMRELIRANKAPAVWVNAKLDSDCVYPDDFGAALSTTRRLIKLGHRRIAFLHMISPGVFSGRFEDEKKKFHFSEIDRAGGYLAAMLEAGLTPKIADHDRFIADEDQMAACRALLRAHDGTGDGPPTAVIVYSERDVSMLMCAAIEAGLSIPRDLSVLAFYPHDLWVAGQYVSPISVPSAEIGRRAVAMLIKKIAAPDEACPPEAVPYEATFGATVAPPPQ